MSRDIWFRTTELDLDSVNEQLRDSGGVDSAVAHTGTPIPAPGERWEMLGANWLCSSSRSVGLIGHSGFAGNIRRLVQAVGHEPGPPPCPLGQGNEAQ